MTAIYVLRDPETLRIRYVGRTIDIEGRLQAHLASPTNPLMKDWIGALRARGLSPIMNVVEFCEDTVADQTERAWIAKLSVSDSLLNVASTPMLGRLFSPSAPFAPRAQWAVEMMIDLLKRVGQLDRAGLRYLDGAQLADTSGR